MGLTQLSTPYPVFTDKNGTPLDNGYVYFGVINDNPETNPIQVFYDPGLTQIAAQPLRTSNGYVMRNGSPAILYAASLFSVTLRDKNGNLVVYAPAGYGVSPYEIAGPASAEVVIVAGIAAEVTAVAAIAPEVEAVGAIAADVSTVAGIAADVTAVAADATDIGIVATNIANVNTVAGISSNVTTVAGISADVTAVAADSVDIGVVAANIANVNAVAGISASVTTVAANAASVTTVAGIAPAVTTVAAVDTEVATVAGISADVSTVSGISADVVIAAANSADITNFADVYQGPYAIAPTVRTNGGPLQVGDLYFNTITDDMWVYDGTQWLAAYASLSGALLAANNLSDLDNAAVALQNLGVMATAAELNTLDGITGIASQAQAEAGTDNATLMTPLRVAQAVDALSPPNGTQEFVATGTISSGQTVGLNADGTVSVVTPYIGAVAYPPSTLSYVMSAAYDPVNNKIMVANVNNATPVSISVGTVSGATITFGAAVSAPAHTYEATSVDVCYNATTNSFVVALGLIRYVSSTTKYYYAYAASVTVSGTVPTVGSWLAVLSSTNTGATFVYPRVDVIAVPGSNTCIFNTCNSNFSYPYMTVLTISGLTLSSGGLYTPFSEFVYDSTFDAPKRRCLAYDTANSKIVFQYINTSQQSKIVVGTISGSSLSFGTPVLLHAATATTSSISYNSSTGKFGYVVGLPTNEINIATGSVSGTSFVLDPLNDVSDTNIYYYGGRICWLNDHLIVPCSYNGVSMRIKSYNLSGTTFTLNRTISVTGTTSGSAYHTQIAMPTANGTVAVLFNYGPYYYPATIIVGPDSTFPSWVGIAAESIASGDSGTVTIIGGTNTSQSGLTPGTTYSLDPLTGGLVASSAHPIGFATSATSIYINTGKVL